MEQYQRTLQELQHREALLMQAQSLVSLATFVLIVGLVVFAILKRSSVQGWISQYVGTRLSQRIPVIALAIANVITVVLLIWSFVIGYSA